MPTLLPLKSAAISLNLQRYLDALHDVSCNYVWGGRLAEPPRNSFLNQKMSRLALSKFSTGNRILPFSFSPAHALILTCKAHHETSLLCGAISTVDPARETTLRALLAGSPSASSTQTASVAVRPTPPAQ